MNRTFCIPCVVAFFIAIFLFCGCDNDDDRYKSYDPGDDTPQVTTLVSPENNASFDLNRSSNVVFSWNEAVCSCEAAVSYQIVFFESDDLTNPIISLASDNEGWDNRATLSKDLLDQIAENAGIPSGETAYLQWAVYAMEDGANSKTISREIRNISIIRFDDTPARVNALITPVDNFTVSLDTVENILFSWEAAQFNGVGNVKYELLLILKGGDFNDPLFDTVSGNQGTATSIQFPASRLDDIAASTGIDENGDMNITWAVRTISGPDNDASISGAVGNLTIVRLKYYSNPVWSLNRPDPSVLLAPDGYFYVYTTGGNINRGRSKDLVHWESLPTAFTNATRPQHVEDAKGVWAPDVEYINGQYVMYYSQNVTIAGGNPNSTIGIATSPTPDGRFTDRGILFQAKDVGIPGGCIDAFFFEENGQKYLFFGSFKGIYGYKLTDDGLAVDGDITDPIQIAGTAYEGGMLFKRGKYYYLFASTGKCCEGKNSTYKLVVGRSENLFGPYLNINGASMSDNKHRVLLDKSDRFVGPGHCSELITDKNGDVWVLYHAFDMTENNGEPTARALMLDKVTFGEQGWPAIRGVAPNVPAEHALAPVF